MLSMCANSNKSEYRTFKFIRFEDNTESKHEKNRTLYAEIEQLTSPDTLIISWSCQKGKIALVETKVSQRPSLSNRVYESYATFQAPKTGDYKSTISVKSGTESGSADIEIIVKRKFPIWGIILLVIFGFILLIIIIAAISGSDGKSSGSGSNRNYRSGNRDIDLILNTRKGGRSTIIK